MHVYTYRLVVQCSVLIRILVTCVCVLQLLLHVYQFLRTHICSKHLRNAFRGDISPLVKSEPLPSPPYRLVRLSIQIHVHVHDNIIVTSDLRPQQCVLQPFLYPTSSSVSYRTTLQITTSYRVDYCALQVSCPVGKVNRQWLSQSISLHSDISSCTSTAWITDL